MKLGGFGPPVHFALHRSSLSLHRYGLSHPPARLVAPPAGLSIHRSMFFAPTVQFASSGPVCRFTAPFVASPILLVLLAFSAFVPPTELSLHRSVSRPPVPVCSSTVPDCRFIHYLFVAIQRSAFSLLLCECRSIETRCCSTGSVSGLPPFRICCFTSPDCRSIRLSCSDPSHSNNPVSALQRSVIGFQ